jgi:hypothetical protein
LSSASRTKIQAHRRARFGRSGASLLPALPSHPTTTRNRKDTIMPQFLAATGRRLGVVANVICHFFRKGKLGLKLAINEIEVSFETDWNRRR